MHLSEYQKDPFMYGKLEEKIQSKVVQSLANPNKLDKNSVNFCSLVSPAPSEKELKFLEQLGVTHCYTWIQPEQATVEFLTNLRLKLLERNITLWNVGMLRVGKCKDIILNTPQRDQMIDEFILFLDVLKQSGIFVTIFTWEPCGVSSTNTNIVRGGAEARACNTNILAQQPIKFNREYSEEELWMNMQYFLDRILPHAEKTGVTLALHPNDPPTDTIIGGIPNIMRSKEAYEKAYKMGKDSKMLKMEFCCGCWLEGGCIMGNLLENLKEFISRDKVVIIHLRNVSSPLPEFTEMFLDEGYGDIWEIVRTVVESGYKGTIILDHSPEIVETPGMETAFCAGYIKGLIRAAQALSKPRTKDLTLCLADKSHRATLYQQQFQQEKVNQKRKYRMIDVLQKQTQQFKYEKFKGIMAASFTPMLIDNMGRSIVQTDIIQAYATDLVSQRVNGVFINGTSGESLSLTCQERKQILQAWMDTQEVKQGKLKTIVHVGSENYQETLELAIHAQELKVSGICMMAPSYFKPVNESHMAELLVSVSSKVSQTPFYFYYIPFMNNIRLNVCSVLSLANSQSRNVIGCKFTDPDLLDFSNCALANFNMLAGGDDITLQFLQSGADGAIGIGFSFLGDLFVDIYQSYHSNDILTATQLQALQRNIYNLIRKVSLNNTAKFITQQVRNLNLGPVRWPQVDLTSEQKDYIQQAIIQPYFQ